MLSGQHQRARVLLQRLLTHSVSADGDTIELLPGEYRERILDETERWALRFFDAFGSVGLGTKVIEMIAGRGDWNSTPERRIVAERGSYTEKQAPDGGEAAHDGKDYSD